MFTNSNDVCLAPIGVRIPTPFYLSLRLEGWIVNNCVIDTRAASTIIPKDVADEMKLYITQCIDGVIQLDYSLVDVIGSVKGVTTTLNICII